MNQEKQSFWKTLPGILTGISAIFIALTGLITAINETGILNIVNKQSSNNQIELPKKEIQLIGNYTVNGKNPDGTSYYGKATIKYEDNVYQIKWEIAEQQIFYGSGMLENNLLKIYWQGGIVTYIIQDDTLVGTWANGKGIDILTRIQSDF
ncbi:MAG: hypothetical protein AB4063_10045 [Crocosphaera sp.]